MVPATGFEPATLGLKDRCSNQAELRRLNGNCGDSKSRPKPGGLPARLAAPVSLPPMRAPAWLIAVVIAVVACNPNSNPTPSPEPLAADQTLSFPIAEDVADFDPALISTAADVDILRNVFSGLYRFDDQLHEVPDIAVGQPTMSTDGLTYTFRIRTDAKFSNGDPITAGDFVYSWNRAAARQGDYAGLFSIIAGYAAVASGKSRVMTGLNNVDDTTLTVTLVRVPVGITVWVGVNVRSGPFAGVEEGRAGRHACSEAIDRQALVEAVCNQKTTCTEATGGVVSKGLDGYLGDGADHNIKFDAAAANAEYQKWDPTWAKVKGLAYTYDIDPFNKAVCANLIAQWKKNLGVDVRCIEMDRKTFFDQRNGACAYPMFRQSWAADYDHPQNWFDYLFVTGASSSGSCYSNPNLDKLVASADAGSPGAGTSGYKVAGFLLVNDSVFGALLYGVQQYLVHPYVKGAGGNALYDYSWTGIRILKH